MRRRPLNDNAYAHSPLIIGFKSEHSRNSVLIGTRTQYASRICRRRRRRAPLAVTAIDRISQFCPYCLVYFPIGERARYPIFSIAGFGKRARGSVLD